jgi:choline-sulfatase
MPNVVIIVSDHLATRAVGAYGESAWADTPHIDGLAQRGVIFENMYTPCPISAPARASFWTGRYPHHTGILHNGLKQEGPGLIPNRPIGPDMPTLGDSLVQAGYTAVHFGKCHDSGALRGFDIVPEQTRRSPQVPKAYPENNDTWRDNYTMDRFGAWADDGFPDKFCCVVDLQNPHNICGWIGAHNSLDGPIKYAPIDGPLPELPANNRVHDWDSLPPSVQYICCSHNRGAQTAHYTDHDWRRYIDAFRHYSKMADDHVGTVLRRLEEGGVLDDTLVIVMADHGDGLGAHQMATKQVSFYEETARVPFIVAGPGAAQGRRAKGLASLLDLFPGVCDYTGSKAPTDLPGKSWLTLLADNDTPHHDYVASEWYSEWGCTVSPGRMIRTQRFKYVSYLEGSAGIDDPTGGEELYDLELDPGEMNNLAADSSSAPILLQHRALLQQHLRSHDDPFHSLEVVVDRRWRSHKPGYHNHTGPTAPMAATE